MVSTAVYAMNNRLLFYSSDCLVWAVYVQQVDTVYIFTLAIYQLSMIDQLAESQLMAGYA